MLSEYAFWFLSSIAVISAMAVVLSKNPVYSVLYLIVTFFSIAGHYFLMNAQFLAAVHIIVYAGAIMVLFLYVIMMLNLNKLDDERKKIWSRALSIAAAGLLMFVALTVIRRTDELTAAQVAVNPEIGFTKNLGVALFRDCLVPFELASVLFLGAMVGAVYLSKKETLNA